jgi:Domain of unknown function (DUF5655)
LPEVDKNVNFIQPSTKANQYTTMAEKKAGRTVHDFLSGKSGETVDLFNHLIYEFGKAGAISLYPAKTMIGIANDSKRIAWITQLGKDFVHVVFPFDTAYPDNLCFQKIAQVPGTRQFNHHFRMYHKEDINEEVISFMRKAYTGK